MSEPLIARVSRLRNGLLVLGAAGFVAAGIFLLGVDDPRRPMMHFWSWVAIVFFGAAALVGIRQFFRTEPVVEIDARGLLWRRWSDERIPWSAFDRAEIGEIRRQRFLSLWLRDPERYRSTSLTGRLAGANKALGFGDISINVTGTDQKFDALAGAINRYAPELRQPGD